MMSPNDYPIKLTKEQEDKFMSLDFHEGQNFLHELEQAAGLRVADPLNNTVLHIVESAEVEAQPAAASQVSITVDGLTFKGTQQECDAQLLAYYRAASASGRLTTTNDTVERDAQGRFAKTKERELTADEATKLTERAKLDLEWRTGQISTEDYFAQTGIFDAYAREKLGIETDPTRREQQQNDAEVQSWTEAASAFLKTPAANDWTGGEENKERLGHMLATLGLTDTPSVESVAEAWLAMKAEDAQTPEEMRAALGITEREHAQALWGRR